MIGLNRNRKGQVGIMIIFFITAIFIIVIAAILAPMGVRFNAEMYKAGEGIILGANDTIASIQNDTVRASLQDTLSQGLAASQNNIEVNAAIFQYGWVFVLIIVALVVFLYTRRLVEYGYGGFI